MHPNNLLVSLSLVIPFAVIEPQSAAAVQSGTPRDVINNATVVEMVAGKLPRNITLAKIRTTANTFDITAAGPVGLQRSKVPYDVMRAVMIAATDTLLAQPTGTPPDALTNADVIRLLR